MKRILNMLRQGFQSSSRTTPEWAHFVRLFRNDLRKELNKVGAQDFELNRGHFYVSGFFRIGDQWFYISISDVRYFPSEYMLIRTARSNFDYTGGTNHHIKIETDMFKKNLHEIFHYIISNKQYKPMEVWND